MTEELTRQRDAALARAQQAEREVAQLRKALDYPMGVSIGWSDAEKRAYEIGYQEGSRDVLADIEVAADEDMESDTALWKYAAECAQQFIIASCRAPANYSEGEAEEWLVRLRSGCRNSMTPSLLPLR